MPLILDNPHTRNLKNSSTPLSFLKKQTTQISAPRWPQPPNANSWGPPAFHAPDPRRHQAQGTVSVSPAPGSTLSPQPELAREAAEVGGSGAGRGASPAASRGAAPPHTPPTPAPEAAARSRREGAEQEQAGQSYSLGKHGCPGLTPASSAVAQRQFPLSAAR